MEKSDFELFNEIAPDKPVLRKLYIQHQKLEREIENIRQYSMYSSSAALRQTELKKQKLRHMEDIIAILKEHRSRELVTH